MQGFAWLALVIIGCATVVYEPVATEVSWPSSGPVCGASMGIGLVTPKQGESGPAQVTVKVERAVQGSMGKTVLASVSATLSEPIEKAGERYFVVLAVPSPLRPPQLVFAQKLQPLAYMSEFDALVADAETDCADRVGSN